MLIYDVLHKEKLYQIVSGNLRSWGVKYRIKKNAVKVERNASTLKKVFKTPLSYLPLDVVTLSSGAIIHVPVFVSQATVFLLQHVREEGLFRKAGSQQRQREIISRLDSGGGLGDKSSPIDVANCLKTFLRSLPEPLIPHTYQDLFVRCHMLRTNKIDALLLACILLPPHHLNTLAYLMEFFKTVASHEKYNKMSIDNIARVVGPNIMPLQETTMVAVQSRLDIHLSIVKILVENAEKIGVLPDDVSEAISMDSVGSMENELDHSDPSSFKNKRKKHRSGSLTRIMSGLKKMVGKNSSPNNTEVPENRLLTCESAKSLHTPALPMGKKRKIEGVNSLNSNRLHGFLEVMPCSSFGHINPQNSPVSNDPNPLKEKSPNQKTGVHRYLSHKIYSDTKDNFQAERPKKHRLSLDRFVPRGKQRNTEKGAEERKKSFSPDTEQRWSETSDLPDSKKRRRTESIESALSCSPLAKLRNSGSDNVLQDVFMEADINLSDECGEQISQSQSSFKNDTHCRRASSTRKSTHSYSLRNCCSPNKDSLDLVECPPEEYVKVPKSEYEEIKSRVSAIESRISQEFKNIKSEPGDVLTINPVANVQNEYEKTLGEASIGDTVSADQLAKRLSRELKIRRSAEHKIIRSPSARKIGSLRRRSQEKPMRKLHRTVSWHSNRDKLPSALKTESRLNNSGGYYPKHCNLKRGRPLVKQNSYKNLNEQGQKSDDHESVCSDETNARLNYLQEQLNTLISHTAEHTRGSFSDDDFAPLDDDVFENAPMSTAQTPIVESSNMNPAAVRRSLSLHGGELIDSSKYFNSRINQLKRDSSQHSLPREKSECPGSITKSVERRKEKTVSWKDADDYFQQESKMLTPVPQTGRASVAKLRTQNAGMVLAKAKLFDDPTKEAVDVSRRQSMKLQLAARISTRDDRVSLGAKRHASSGDVIIRRKPNGSSNRRSPVSPIIRMAVTITSGSQRRQSSRFGNSRCASQEEVIASHRSQKENQLIRSNSESVEPKRDVFKPGESPMCKTPLIKRPLSVKTPKSAKSLSARKSASVTSASRRTPLKAVLPITPRRQSPRSILKSTHLTRHAS